ncbi:MAG: ATP-binding cassette domain-containing protein [Campylobacteraceae bacterium]|nr:ATP-binding cassette domain-containing protein [Campylobacteraceae bacterium]
MIIELKDIVTSFGTHVVHDGVSLSVKKGEIFGILGGSGSGKTVLMREMIFLHRQNSGEVKILGYDTTTIDEATKQSLRLRWGVLFQFGALFSSLSVLENVMIPLQEYTKLPCFFIEDIAKMKLRMAGLEENVGKKNPSELSGGMRKRVGLARALALDPEILFLDEPTSGLDPASARAFDALIVKLRDLLGITVVIVTHDKDTIANVLDRFIILSDKKVKVEGSYETLMRTEAAFMKKFLEH